MRGVSFFLLILFSVATAGPVPVVPSDPLSRGIALYREGKDEAAIIELRRAIDLNLGRALGYYYAARIRLRMEQPVTARNNLLAALADSAGFHDALGLLAWTNLKLGNTADALIEWRRFISAVGELHPGEKVSPSSVMLPEEYREQQTRARAVADSAASNHAVAVMPGDSARTAVQTAVGKPDSAGPAYRGGLSDLDRRIEGQIRRGYYGIGAAAVLLTAGITGIAWWMRRHRKSSISPDFHAEVDRLLESREETDEFSLDDEELATRERKDRVRQEEVQNEENQAQRHKGIKAQSEEQIEHEGIVQIPKRKAQKEIPESEANILAVAEKQYSGSEGWAQESQYPESPDGFRPENSKSAGEPGRRPITEEVKALVARLYREGQSTVDIARLADLTRTEVELIVAVRTRDVEQIVETALEEQEPETTAIHRAVAELAAEGRSTVEIARRLGISTSEVSLALKVMESWKKGKRK